IFDLDGVIIDSEPVHFAIEERMFKEIGISMPPAEHHSYVGTSSINMWQTVLRKYNVRANPLELTLKGRSDYLDYLKKSDHLLPVEGVAELIKDLYKNQFKLLIASSSHKEVIHAVLERFGLSKYFNGTISGTELINSKPHPEIFIRSAQMVQCEACNCVVIEDSENGIKAAKAAAMKCIGYLNPGSGNQDLSDADLVIHSFEEINAGMIKHMNEDR
ncbi:MAG: HAD family hydrolase, partial [Flavisolibacter sp.]